MRSPTTIALALLTALASAAAGQPPPTNPPTPATATPPSSSAPSAPPAAPGTVYPTEIAGRKLEEWIKDIDSPDPGVRETAIRIVVQFGPPARRAIPALINQVRAILNDLSPHASAIIALSELVPQGSSQGPVSASDGYTKEAVEVLTKALNSTQAIIRYRAATALAWIGPPARTAVPALISKIDDRYSYEIRKAVCIALGTAGRDENGWPIPGVLEALSRAANDRDCRDVRIEALQAIVNLGPAMTGGPPQVIGFLKQRLTSERDKTVVIWVRVALMRIDPPSLTDANVQVISKQLAPKPGVPLEIRVQAAKALGYMAVAGKPGLSDMIDALQSSDQNVLTAQLCWSLARMGQYAERALPALRQVEAAHKDDKDNWIRDSAKVAAETIEKAVEKQRAPPPPPPPPPPKP